MTLTELSPVLAESREQRYPVGWHVFTGWGCIAQAPGAAGLVCAASLPQHQQAFVAIPLPKSKGTPLPSLTHCLELRLCLGEETGAIGRDPGSVVALHGDAGCLSCWGATVAL